MTRELISLSEARERVLAATVALPAEEIALADALGRVLAEDVAAPHDLPPFDASAMDGYAVIAGPAAELAVVGESRAGRPAERPLAPGEAIGISTGAVVPAGADAVVPVERTTTSDGRVSVPDTVPGANIRRAGEDVESGAAVLAAGTDLGPAELAVLSSLGRDRAHCGARPRVAVLVTGDELVPPGPPLGPGQIRDSNATALAAQSTRAGARVELVEHVPDERGATIAALERALATADVVCISGGVSVGEHDHVKQALAAVGAREDFWGIALKPGKPTWFGTHGGGKLVFGLPGNPVSAMVVFHLIARPALRALQGGNTEDVRVRGILGEGVRLSARTQALRCRLEAKDDGWHVTPTKAQGSHVLTSMLSAQALALIPPGDGTLDRGARVDAELLAPGTLSA
ncbi:MAG: molybdopterin molybdotransferase [Thermoleophilaceae bacterium]|nr:molybdopterin molybdotransferase [Thermoleophilaceae bacterium]